MAWACDSMLLGSLIKALQAAGLHPLPQSPYTGISFVEVSLKLTDLQIHALCENWILPMYTAGYKWAHGYNSEILEEMNAIDNRLEGLEIDSFREPVVLANTPHGSECGDTVLNQLLDRKTV